MNDIIAWILFLLVPLLIISGAMVALFAAGRERRRARRGGCVCYRTELFHFERSNCPYCSKRKRGK